MSTIQSLEFAALELSGDNYLTWAQDITVSLNAKGIGETIIEGNEESNKSRYQALQIIRQHLSTGLKGQYLTVTSPLDLWNDLKKRYEHQKMLLLPMATYEWKNLRFQDFKSVEEYNSALFTIVSQMRLCGETVSEHDMLEKTFTTFAPQNVVLQQQYRERNFSTYTELISCLLLAEKNNQLVLMNSELRPPGTKALPEAHAAKTAETEVHYTQNKFRKGRGSGRSKGKGRGNQGQNHGNRDQKSNSGGVNGRGKGITKPQSSNKKTTTSGSVCHRCGMSNHWAKTCRSSKYVCDLYQALLHSKGKAPEANLASLAIKDTYEDPEDDFDAEEDDLMEYEQRDMLKESN